MNDLISRSALLKELCNSCDGWCDNTECDCLNCKSDHRCDMVQDIADAPAVDAVEVVRCKDCKWLYNGLDMYCCTKHTGLALITPDGSGFCSYGERRADDA